MGITERSSNAEKVIETANLTLSAFAKAMDNAKAPSEAVGIEQQTNLLSTLKLIFRLDGDDFNAAWRVFLDWTKNNINNCMAVNARSRYLHVAKKISATDQNALLLIVHLACMLADTKVREQVVQRFDYGRLDRIWPTMGGGDKLRNYFASR